jgi:hypothetical protein
VRNDIIWAKHVLSEHVSKIFSSALLVWVYACPLPRAPEITAQPKSFLIYFFIPADVSKMKFKILSYQTIDMSMKTAVLN